MLTRDDVIRMAKQAGGYHAGEFHGRIEAMERFAAAAYAAGAAAEREACAQVCDHIADQQERANYDKRAACAADQCAIAIRQRAAYRDLTPDELAAADRRPESGDFDRRNHG